MKKLLLLLSAILISVYGHAQSLLAVPDTFTVLQTTVDTFAVTTNDSIPAGDSVCISLLDTASRFSVLNCRSIIYRPDSAFTGRDTCRYVLCDTALVCDTAMVVVYVDSLSQLLPLIAFKQDTAFPGRGNLFNCNIGAPSCIKYRLVNTSMNYDSVSWILRDLYSSCGYTQYDSIIYFHTDTVIFEPQGTLCVDEPFIVCLTAYNQYGSVTLCDTTCFSPECEGIAEVPLSNIHLYPNPTDRILTIDMRQNTNPISADYAAIEIYNTLGQKVRSIPRHDSSRLVEVAVEGLPDGIYVSTIVDAGGREMVLGRFTVLR